MRQRRFGLQIRLIALLLAIGLTPVAVAAVLIQRIAEVAQSFASNEAARLTPPLERAEAGYRQLIEQTKRLHRQIGARVADDSTVVADPELAAAGLVSVSKVEGRGAESELWRGRDLTDGERRVDIEVDGSEGRFRLGFAVDRSTTTELQAIGAALVQGQRVQAVRDSLPSSYRTAFVLVVGGFAVLLAVIGVLIGRTVTRRIDDLEAGFAAVARGDLGARVSAEGEGELAEMSRAFNRMVADLDAERRKSTYLQRIGTWQDVARKLAHEIKNPLTPIRLAMQQVSSSYTGDDPRFAKLLRDADEIVAEEIENLRRLVDAFRELGRLPRVEAAPVDLATVLADLGKEPELGPHLVIDDQSPPIRLQADRLLLRRVLHNLVENGIQAADGADRLVRVSWTATDDGRAEITVDDSGQGVPDALRTSLFEPYVTSKDTGTGLGLAIAKKIAIEHGGSLELADEAAPTGGARFVLTIPMVEA